MEEKKYYLAIRTRNLSTRIDVEDILYLERRSRKVFVVTEGEEIEYYEQFDLVTPLLTEVFIPVRKGLYINLPKVRSVKDNKCIFSCGKEIHLPEKPFSKLKISHNAYYRTHQLRMVREKQMDYTGK